MRAAKRTSKHHSRSNSMGAVRRPATLINRVDRGINVTDRFAVCDIDLYSFISTQSNKMSDDSGRKDVRYFVSIFIGFHTLVYLVPLVWVVPQLVYQYPVAPGVSTNLTYTLAWWCVAVWVGVNYLLIVILSGAMVERESLPRIDVHLIATVVAVVVNVLAVVLCTVCYFFYMNTSYSGNFPFNDYLWCCVYQIDHPELCPNSITCSPEPSLSANTEFVVLWIFSGVLLLITLVHLGINRLVIISGAAGSGGASESGGRFMGLVVSFVYQLLFAYWAAWPLFDTIYIHGYPLLGIPPGPGPLASIQYGWQWWFMWLMVFNYLPGLAYTAALQLKKSHLVTAVHFWTSLLVGFVTSVVFLVLLGILIFDCNYGWTGGSICNDYRWCCQYFAGAVDICGNVTPCIGGAVNLYPNGEFVQHVVFSLIFVFMATVEVWLNYRMIKYGIFQ